VVARREDAAEPAALVRDAIAEPPTTDVSI
jgi:hypothetical protein